MSMAGDPGDPHDHSSGFEYAIVPEGSEHVANPGLRFGSLHGSVTALNSLGLTSSLHLVCRRVVSWVPCDPATGEPITQTVDDTVDNYIYAVIGRRCADHMMIDIPGAAWELFVDEQAAHARCNEINELRVRRAYDAAVIDHARRVAVSQRLLAQREALVAAGLMEATEWPTRTFGSQVQHFGDLDAIVIDVPPAAPDIEMVAQQSSWTYVTVVRKIALTPRHNSA